MHAHNALAPPRPGPRVAAGVLVPQLAVAAAAAVAVAAAAAVRRFGHARDTPHPAIQLGVDGLRAARSAGRHGRAPSSGQLGAQARCAPALTTAAAPTLRLEALTACTSPWSPSTAPLALSHIPRARAALSAGAGPGWGGCAARLGVSLPAAIAPCKGCPGGGTRFGARQP